jgi:hypothetical protein
MKAFELTQGTRLKVTKVTPRKELHGDDRVQAVSLRLRWETVNDSLAKLHPNLKDALFWRPPAAEAQQDIEGQPQTVPFLRVPIMARPVKIDADFSGYTLTIEHGIDDSSALELYDVSLDKFAVDAKEGGTAVIEFSAGSNKEVTSALVGELCDLEGSEIVVQMVAPKAPAPVIDGTQAAFDADHGPVDDRDAGDLFAEQHGGAGDDRDQHAGDFGTTDTDTGAAEQAELEAGMSQALAAAGVKPKRGRAAAH